MLIPDNLLINLRILSKIQKNGRITRSYDGVISLESDKYYQPIKRFLTQDSRKQAVFEINSIIVEAISTLGNILHSRYMSKVFCKSDEYLKNCENIHMLLNELEQARRGIEHLRFTYQNDLNTVSQLDIIILKINTTLREIGSKLKYYKQFLPNGLDTKFNLQFTPSINTELDDNNNNKHQQENHQTEIYQPEITMENPTEFKPHDLESVCIDSGVDNESDSEY